MASVQWPLLIVTLLTGVGTVLLFTNDKSEEDLGYGVQHRVLRGYESDSTLTSKGIYRYNAPPKNSDKDDDDTAGDSKGKNSDERDKSKSKKDKTINDVKEDTDKEEKKNKKSGKDKESSKEDKADKKDKGTKKKKISATDEKNSKEDKGSAEKDEHIAVEDNSTEKSSKQRFLLSKNKDCLPTPIDTPRGGRSLQFGEALYRSSDQISADRPVLELSITVNCNRTEEDRPKPKVDCVDKSTFKKVFESFRYLAFLIQRTQTDYSSILMNMFALDCSDMVNLINESSLQTFNLGYKGKRPITVMCDMDTDGGGWTVVQRRNSDSKLIDFNRGWYEYKVGFGDPAGEYWVGLDNLYAWTNMRQYQLRIELMDFEGNCKYAAYKQFYVDDEAQGYRLHVTGYVGNAGDALTKKNIRDNFTADGMMFSTKDRDNDMAKDVNCAQLWKSGGWWYNRCAWANLNGPSWIQADGTGIGINWHTWRNKEHLKSAIMMIKPIGPQ